MRILLIASKAESLINFRGDFILSLIENGYAVVSAAPDMSETVSQELKNMGAKPVSFFLQRTGQNPLKDIKSVKQLKKIIKNHKIDLVFPYTIKPVIYGSMAANMAGVPVISLITGLGFSFSGASRKAKVMEVITVFLYKLSVRKNKLIIFQNIDDYWLFRKKKILSENHKYQVVNGSGVNLDRFSFRINKKDTTNIKFILVARLIKEKGVDLFLKTAIILKNSYPNAEFHIVGPESNSPSGISLNKLNQLNNEGTIIYHGLSDNIPELLNEMDVFVLPTYYREGVPRSILEALSIGMPVITTDTPGCKETVLPLKNGFLIPPKKLEPLIEACGYFLENPSSVEQMGKQSRDLAEQKFDVNIINQYLINYIKEVIHH